MLDDYAGLDLNSGTPTVSHKYAFGYNVLSVRVPLTDMISGIMGPVIFISMTKSIIALVLVMIELSMASPGTASAVTIMFETLGMSTSYVGLFTVYRMFTNNYSAACTEAYVMLVEV